MKKKLFATCMAAILLFGMAVPAMAEDSEMLRLRDRLQITSPARIQQQDRLRDGTGPGFPDVQRHWALEPVQEAAQWGLVKGYPDGSFGPNRNISGPEGVMMLSRMRNCLAGVDTATGPAMEVVTGPAVEIDWDRLPPWAREQMREETALRIATQSEFYKELQLNRLQLAVMLAKALDLEPMDVPAGTTVFSDTGALPAEDLGHLHALKSLGIIQGYQGAFNPERLVNRAEAAVMMVNVLRSLDEKAGEYSVLDLFLTVKLQENPSTGYAWAYQMDKEGILELDSDAYAAPDADGGMVGAAGQHTWVFKGVGEGTVRLEFHYYRPWEAVDTAVDARIFTVSVGADKTIVDVR
ncbi:protease inhibitor I42 family protein [Anaerotalea alkaliphila]|uniref:SLH domain-containing protein n=1 Tax=Anaerotalea alkaliphila TaxID=2662126 RepID=A0A7X5KM24_9FIRM|nr:protease inhibitor I42 family protein [Anaerotalea alkaliphila]NDL67486.1 hypothetical protein [Anaerotalea alkaliphila]